MEKEIRKDETLMYVWAGRALCEAQNLETHLTNLIVVQQMLSGKAAEVPSLQEIYAKYDRKTLGNLLKTVRKYIQFDSGFDTKLQRTLKLRNTLVHRYFADLIARHGYEKGKRLAPLELRQLTEVLTETTTELFELTVKFASALGLKPEIINRRLSNMGADFKLDWSSN